VGPSVAGALIAATGEGVCFLLNGLSYFVVIISLLKMKISNRQSKKEKTHILKELKEGFSYTFGSLAIRNIILLLGLVSLMGMSYTVILPVFVKEVLHSGSHSFGFLMGASGLVLSLVQYIWHPEKTFNNYGKLYLFQQLFLDWDWFFFPYPMYLLSH